MLPAKQHVLLAVTGAASAAVILLVFWRRQKPVPGAAGREPLDAAQKSVAVTYGDITVREAVQGDLPHLESLSRVAGQQIVPGGGDFVLKAWKHEWWTLDPRTHWNAFAFANDSAVAFARVEAYGPAEALESGWLMAMRVRPEFQRQRVMGRLQAHLLARLPSAVRGNLYLAVGSMNETMRKVCEPRYEFHGAYVLQSFMPSAMLRADRERYAALLSIRPLEPHDVDAAWAFLSACLDVNSKLLLPGRFYDFRRPSRGALADKIREGRAVAARDGTTIVALFFQFDGDDIPEIDGPGRRRIFTCCAAAGLEAANLGSALLAFGKAQPTIDPASGVALRTQLSVGPCIDKDGRDVEPKTAIALSAGSYTRPRSTHLRVYRIGKDS